ncbi:MAG: hypothetical protein H0X72_18745 [Acidobacteria bacterium]|nr:hypothetical protein [Acidobacteriota bacterium]
MREKTGRLNILALLLTLLAFAATAVVAQNGRLQTKGYQVKSKSLERAFEKAAVEFGVPSELLKTIAYSETHFDNHKGEPSIDNGYGVMHLADNNENQSLNRAAATLQVPADVLKKDDWQNIRGDGDFARVCQSRRLNCRRS